MTTERVQNLFQLLQDSWETGDADSVARRFLEYESLLLPLDVYEAPKRGYQEIRDHFEDFLSGEPAITSINRTQISIDPSMPGHQSWAKDVGTLQITFKKDQTSLKARYSLDYVLDEDGVWKILQFQVTPLPQDWDQLHAPDRSLVADSESSLPGISLPERSKMSNNTEDGGSATERQQGTKQRQAVLPPTVTEEQVRGWFEEWNNAMATGDPKVVADRYVPSAVMLPTISDKPRTTPQEILEFYQLFLWSRPRARALQSYVTVSTHYCKDVGVLEYALKDSQGHIQQRIRERYSFLYVYDEAGGWKIAHHHSSVMPDGVQEAGRRIDDEDNDSRFFQ